MPKKQLAQASAKIVKFLHGINFQVEFAKGFESSAYLSGKMRRENQKKKFQIGDKVVVEYSTNISTLDNCRIIERKK